MFIPGGGIVSDVCTGNSPVLKSYDLSAFSGQTVKLRIGATSQNCCGTNALFDDVVVSPEAGTHSAKVLITASPGGVVSYAFAGGSGNIGGGTSKVISVAVGNSLSLTAAPSYGSTFSTWSFTTGVDTTFNYKPLDRTSPSVTPVINGNGMIVAKFSSTPAVTNLLISANSSVATEGPGSSSRITATVLDQFGMPISGVSVDFKSTKGMLSLPSSTTDSLGHASATLTPNFLTSSAVVASVSVMANGLTAVKDVTFVPPEASSTECNTSQSWKSCGAFSITTHSMTIPQAVKQLPVIGGVGNALLSSALDDYPISLYSLGPNCSTDTCKVSFTNNLQSQFGISVPTGYQATQVMILEVPLISILDNTICHHANVVIPFTNVVIGTIDIGCLNIPATNNGVQWAWGFKTTFAGVTPYIQLTRAGSLDLVLTFSTNPKAASAINTFELLSQMAQLAIGLVKHGAGTQDTLAKALQTISTALSRLANAGDVTLSVITSDLSTVGVLSSYSIFDFDDFANTVSLALDTAGVVMSTGSSNHMVKVAADIMTAGFHFGTGDIPAALIQIGVCVLDTVNLATQYVVSQPPLSDNWVAKGIAAAFGIVISVIDPMASTVVPSYYDSRGQLILGYNVTSGTTIFRNSSGVLFATNDTYYAYIFGGGNVTVRLNAIGTRGVLVPYELEAYNTERVVSTQTRYTGLLEVGAGLDVDVDHATSDGSVVPQLSVIPTVQVTGNQVFVIPFLTNGTKVPAESAFVFVGCQAYQMDEVNATLFKLDLNPALGGSILAAYVVVDGFVGGYATVNAPPATGSLTVTVSGPSGPIEGATVMIVSGPYGQMLPASATTGTDGTVTFSNLIPGTYSYTVAAGGYQGSQTITVMLTSGQTTPNQAILQPNPSPRPQPNYTTLYLALGAVGLVVILVGFVTFRRRRGTKI